MKKLFSTLWMALFLLSACGTAAYADVLFPGAILFSPPVLPWVLIGVAVIVAAVIIGRSRKRRAENEKDDPEGRRRDE